MQGTAVLTGATAGVGLALAQSLASQGWSLVLGVRSPSRGDHAIATIRRGTPAASVRVLPLDLADLASVRGFARQLEGEPVDRLVLNAGVMTTSRQLTVDGFELMLGTNHLGHVALTAHLAPSLRTTPGARVVVQSSESHRHGHIALDDLMMVRSFRPVPAYHRSKLAVHLFGVELGRRAPFEVVVCQPGWVRSELGREISGLGRLAFRAGDRVIGQSTEEGARPAVHAVVDRQVPPAAGGDYLSPGGFQRLRGRTTTVRAADRALDPEVAALLWRRSEELVGVDLAALHA